MLRPVHDKHAARRKLLHQTSTLRHERQAIFELENASKRGRYVLSKTMTDHRFWSDSPRQPQLCQRIADRKDCRLCDPGLLQLCIGILIE